MPSIKILFRGESKSMSEVTWKVISEHKTAILPPSLSFGKVLRESPSRIYEASISKSFSLWIFINLQESAIDIPIKDASDS